jgi:hypothetical protein
MAQNNVMGSSSIVYDIPNNKVRGYSRTELDYNTAAYYTAYVCGSLYKNGVQQVRFCQSGFITASANTQYTGVTTSGSVTSDHYVDLQYFDEPNQSYIDYLGYSFLPGYTYPLDWLFYASNIFTYIQPVSIRLGSTTVDCRCSCNARPSQGEFDDLKAMFPKLVQCHVCRNGPPGDPDEGYNCLAWVIGDLTKWHDKQVDIDKDQKVEEWELDAYIGVHNPSALFRVDYYGRNQGDILHVSLKMFPQGGLDCMYTSKLGGWLLIAHDRSELEATQIPPGYGNIVGGY